MKATVEVWDCRCRPCTSWMKVWGDVGERGHKKGTEVVPKQLCRMATSRLDVLAPQAGCRWAR